MVCKYALCYGRKGVEKPKTQRWIWRDAVLGRDESGDADASCANLLNDTTARRTIAKADCMLETVYLPLSGRTGGSESARYQAPPKSQEDGETGTHTTPGGKYRNRAFGDGRDSPYGSVCRSGDGPVFTGASLRPQFPPSEGFARAMLHLHKPRREADGITGGARGYERPRIQ